MNEAIDWSLISDEDLNREYWRRAHARKAPGRPKKMSPCPKCGAQLSARELKIHLPKCEYHLRFPKSLQRYAPRIADYSDERSGGNPIFIAYKAGWRSCSDPLGIVHGDTADTVKEASSWVRNAEHCDCQECLKDTKQVAEC